MKFSTKDVLNDHAKSHNGCAVNRQGAWWFRQCCQAHLNGEYLEGEIENYSGIMWAGFKGRQYSYKIAEMKVAPV